MSRLIYRYCGVPGLAFVGIWLTAEILRLALWVVTPQAHGVGIIDTSLMFFTGTIYDAIVAIFLVFGLSLVRLLVPLRWLGANIRQFSGFAVLFAILFGAFFVAVAEWLFWDEFSSRFNFIAVDYLVYRREVTDNINESYNIPWLLAVIATIAIAIAFIAHLFHRHQPVFNSIKHRFLLVTVTGLLSLLSMSVSSNLGKSVSDNRYVQELSENGIYQFFHAFDASELDFLTFYDSQPEQMNQKLLSAELNTHASHYDISRDVVANAPERHLNVILVVVESLSAKYLGSFGNTEGLTPFLDSLSEQSLTFSQFYATGTRTVRGLEAVSLSIPPTPGRSIVKRKHNESLYNIGTEFNNRNYDVSFFYGGFGYFDNMNYFFGHNGFNVIDRTDFNDSEVHFSNAWGVADEDVFAKVITHADNDFNAGKPFFNIIMTTSNHRPYTYPEGHIDIESGSGRNGAVKYTDYALGRLIETAREKPWFDDTIFVIVADHCAGVAGKTALPVENYRIPLMIYAPKHIAARRIDALSSQIDLAPTLLGLLNFSYQSFFFGHDVLIDGANDQRAYIANYQSLGLLKNDLLTVLEPQRQHYQIVDPLTESPRKSKIVEPALLKQTIALYQSADYVYRNQLSFLPTITARRTESVAKNR